MALVPGLRCKPLAAGLLAAGRAYHCFCPEERLEELRAAALADGRQPRYDGRCRSLGSSEVQERLATSPARSRLSRKSFSRM